MAPYTLNLTKSLLKQTHKKIAVFVLFAFGIFSINIPAYAQLTSESPMPWMPKPGVRIQLSPEFTPAFLKGITIHPENALMFDFIIQRGDKSLSLQQKQEEYKKLIKYFLASLAIPDEDQWVNLSPYEKNRIIKDDFGKTEMGRDLLAQDYILKQITASLIYPEDSLGKKFWDKVYTKAQQQFGTTDIPVNTFNKVWIVPDNALIYEKGNTAYVLKNHLKVMLEEDYLSLSKHAGITDVPPDQGKDINKIGSQVVREIVLPALEQEVNTAKNFVPLRQVYSGMILAAWYKRVLKESLLGKIYANKAKVKGVDQNPQNNEEIYHRYLRAYKKGVFNYIKEDVDKYTNETIPRKYFSGGTTQQYDNPQAPGYLKETDDAMIGDRVINTDASMDGGQDIVRAKAVELPEISNNVSQVETGDKILGAMHEGNNPAGRLDALRRLLRMKGIDIEDWTNEQARKMNESDADALKEALALIGLKPEQATILLDKIILVDVPAQIRLEGKISRIGGVVINTKNGLRILFPRNRIVQGLPNREFLGDLLHEVVEIQAIERGVSVDDAHALAMQERDKFLDGQNDLASWNPESGVINTAIKGLINDKGIVEQEQAAEAYRLIKGNFYKRSKQEIVHTYNGSYFPILQDGIENGRINFDQNGDIIGISLDSSFFRASLDPDGVMRERFQLIERISEEPFFAFFLLNQLAQLRQALAYIPQDRRIDSLFSFDVFKNQDMFTGETLGASHPEDGIFIGLNKRTESLENSDVGIFVHEYHHYYATRNVDSEAGISLQIKNYNYTHPLAKFFRSIKAPVQGDMFETAQAFARFKSVDLFIQNKIAEFSTENFKITPNLVPIEVRLALNDVLRVGSAKKVWIRDAMEEYKRKRGLSTSNAEMKYAMDPHEWAAQKAQYYLSLDRRNLFELYQEIGMEDQFLSDEDIAYFRSRYGEISYLNYQLMKAKERQAPQSDLDTIRKQMRDLDHEGKAYAVPSMETMVGYVKDDQIRARVSKLLSSLNSVEINIRAKPPLASAYQNDKIVGAMHERNMEDNTKGGIDLNAANLNLQIKRDGKGVPLPISQQDLENIKIDGLVPVIIDIKPVLATPVLSDNNP